MAGGHLGEVTGDQIQNAEYLGRDDWDGEIGLMNVMKGRVRAGIEEKMSKTVNTNTHKGGHLQPSSAGTCNRQVGTPQIQSSLVCVRGLVDFPVYSGSRSGVLWFLGACRRQPRDCLRAAGIVGDG